MKITACQFYFGCPWHLLHFDIDTAMSGFSFKTFCSNVPAINFCCFIIVLVSARPISSTPLTFEYAFVPFSVPWSPHFCRLHWCHSLFLKVQHSDPDKGDRETCCISITITAIHSKDYFCDISNRNSLKCHTTAEICLDFNIVSFSVFTI
jgi:hypothetical protein